MEYINRLLGKKLSIDSRLAYTLAAIFILIMFDVSQMPEKQVTAKVLIFGITVYQKTLSHRLSGLIQCKFQPTCSHYTKTSIEYYGAFWGTIKGAQRLWRCSPWSDSHGWDPP